MKPDPKMVPYWHLWLAFWIVVVVLSWSVPIAIFGELGEWLLIYLLSVYVPTIIALGYIIWWISKFYKTIEYELREGAVHSKFGVFFKREKEIGYGRITMAGLSQGPLKRHFGIYNVPIFTAARGGTNMPEMCFMNVKNGPEIRDHISAKIGKLTEETQKTIEQETLDEIKKIREILDKSQKG